MTSTKRTKGSTESANFGQKLYNIYRKDSQIENEHNKDIIKDIEIKVENGIFYGWKNLRKIFINKFEVWRRDYKNISFNYRDHKIGL